MQTGGVSQGGSGSSLTDALTKNPALKGEMGKDAFLKLLVTQLQNQDPLNPTDNTQFVSQLAQFSSLEGLTNIQKSMDGVSSSMSSFQNMSSASLIGKGVRAQDSAFTVNGGPVTLGYSLDAEASDVTVTITDQNGSIVRQVAQGRRPGGQTVFSWDGNNSAGKPVAPGVYNLSVAAKAQDGSAITAATYITGTVTSVSFDTNGAASLMVGGRAISRDKIKEIY